MRLVRSIIGFFFAALVAGAVQVAFVITPGELAHGDQHRLSAAGMLLLVATAQTLGFVAPLAVLGAIALRRGDNRWRSIPGVIRYPVTGLVLALLEALVLLLREAGGANGVDAAYAVTALASSGAAGGLVYWLMAGRRRAKVDCS